MFGFEWCRYTGKRDFSNGIVVALVHNVQRAEAQYVVLIGCNEQERAETQCAWKDITAVVVGVLSDKVDTPRRKEDVCCIVLVGLLKCFLQFR